MSRVSTANSAAPRSFASTMQLPNVPRLTADEKSRSKYISEYERFEPELRRHHIGTAETTNTLGLKDVPAEFDRTVPALHEPTRAEREQERQNPRRGRSARRDGDDSSSGPVRRPPSTVSLLPAAAAAKRAATHSASTTPPPQRGGVVVVEGGSQPLSGRKPSPNLHLPKQGKKLPAVLHTVASADAADSITVAAAVAAPPAASPRAAVVAAERPAGAAAAAVVPTPPSHLVRLPTTAPPPSLLKKKAAAESKGAMSVPRIRSAPPQPIKTTHAAPHVTAAHAVSNNTAVAENALRGHSDRHAHSTTAPPPPPAPKAETSSAAETAKVLCVLLDPPPQYMASLELDLTCYDLEWMRSGAALPRHMITIANCVDMQDSVGPLPKINSPRSVISLLERGVSLKDWLVGDNDAVAARGSTSGRLNAELQQHRRARQQEQQRAIREQLEQSYHALCLRAPLQEVVACYRQARHAALHPDEGIGAEEKAALSTAALQRQERQRRVFDTNKMRMLRQVQQAQEMQERQLAAERRQQQAKSDAGEERRKKAQEEADARRQQQERLEGRRTERELRDVAVRAELQSRMQKVESRNAERAAARMRQQRAVQQEREAQAAERARRVMRNTALLEEQALVQEQRRAEKTKKLEEMLLAREARLSAEQQQQKQKQLRAAQQRDEARQRATEAEEAARAAALERQAHAEARLQDFYVRRGEEAAQRALAEAQHQQRLEEARAEAHEKEERFRADIQDKLLQHEERYQDARTRQMADIAWKREAEREEQEDKAYAVLQLQRMAEFEKLRTVVNLLEKRRAANAITRQRELVSEQSMRDRNKLRDERDALKEQLAKAAP